MRKARARYDREMSCYHLTNNATRPPPRHGVLWMDRFGSVLLDKDKALWNCLTYVETNPVRAGLAEPPAD